MFVQKKHVVSGLLIRLYPLLAQMYIQVEAVSTRIYQHFLAAEHPEGKTPLSSRGPWGPNYMEVS